MADSITTFIGFDANIRGEIELAGTVRIDGKVEGAVNWFERRP